MSTTKLPLEQVRTLPFYGRHFPFIPWGLGSKLRISVVYGLRLLEEIGAARFAGFWLRLPFRLAPVYREMGAGFGLMRRQFGLIAEVEWVLLVLIHRDMERLKGQERAYAFAKETLQECSVFMMPDFYQADRLAQFADPFEAFWLYHKAMFEGDPNYPNEMMDEGDRKRMIVHQCRNCEIARMTVPALASLGCDHDITGYQAIAEQTQMEFRRPVTLAKDGEPCQFVFYRKGTAPADGSEIH